jgi:hypothetical protein
MTPWLEVLSYFLVAAAGILANFFFISWKAGRYIERVERLTGEVERYELRVESLERKFAAVTGKANGDTFR